MVWRSTTGWRRCADHDHARVPTGEYLTDEVRRVLLAGGAVDRVEVVITHEPAWTPEMMADETKLVFGW